MDLKTFFEQFDTIAEAPGGIQRLRNLILDMAVRGKLVPQDPDDEPANFLLQRIQAEIKQKSSQRKKPRTQASEILPFPLPKSWLSVSLEDISVEVHYGLTASANHENTDIKFLRITDIQNDSVNWLSVPGCNVDKEKAEKYRLKNSDIVIARTGGTVGKSYLVESLSDKDFAVFASYLIRVVPSAEVNPHYLKLTMGTSLYWEQLSDNTTGTGQPNVNATSLKGFILPLPPIAEQKRIVAKVDELMGLCDQFEAEKQQRDSLRQHLRASAFAALMNAPTDDALSTAWSFIHQHWHPLTQHPDDVKDVRRSLLQLAVRGKLVPQDPEDEPANQLINRARKLASTYKTGKKDVIADGLSDGYFVYHQIPKDWLWIRLRELVLSMNNGLYKPVRFYSDKGIASIRMFNIQDGTLITDKLKRVEVTEDEYSTYKLSTGDLVVNRVNSRELVGKTAVVDSINEPMVFEAMNIRVRLLPNFSHPHYINLVLLDNKIRQILFDVAKQASGQASISQPQVGSLPIPLPPLAEQKRIVAKVDELMRECDQLESQLRRQQQVAEQFAASAVSHLAV